jgi:hypothetical protein
MCTQFHDCVQASLRIGTNLDSIDEDLDLALKLEPGNKVWPPYVHILVHACMRVCIHTNAHACIHVYLCIYMYIYACLRL